MRTDLNTGGFTLYEIMISITIVGIITGLLSVSLFPLLAHSEFVNTEDQVKDSLWQAQWLTLNRLESHRLKGEFGKLLLQRKNNGSYETVLEEKVPEKISINATRWPSFRAFGFTAGGTITLETKYYITKVVVSPIGRIRQTEILKK